MTTPTVSILVNETVEPLALSVKEDTTALVTIRVYEAGIPRWDEQLGSLFLEVSKL